MLRSPAVPYVAPFAAFLAVLALGSVWPLSGAVDQLARIAIVAAVLLAVSRPAMDFRVRSSVGTVAMGAVIFVIWIAPDLIYPDYRRLWLFNNPITGSARSTLPPADLHDPVILLLRTLRAAVLVPIVEELFWRGWLMRWLIAQDFRTVALGTYAKTSFWVVAALFASEHGPYWDVGLLAGVLFNAWMIRTNSLGDLILCHAVANLLLSAYVITGRKWEYWM